MHAITGASGRLGRDIATRAGELGQAENVVLLTRRPDEIRDLEDRGFHIRHADFADSSSMASALQGVESLLMISATGPASQRIPLHRKAVDAIEQSDVGRVVYTSRVAPSSSSPYPFAAIHEDSEARLASLGRSYTFLRNNEYVENLDHFLIDAARTGVLHYGAKGPIAFVARKDVVTIAVDALLDDSHECRIYEVSGPEACDRVQLGSLLSAAVGREILAHDGTAEDFGRAVRTMGAPDFIAEMCVGLYQASEQGEWAATMPENIRTLLPTAPTSVSEYVRQTFEPGGRLAPE